MRSVLLIALGGLLFAGSARADTLLLFTVDTNSVSGTSGYLDFQFNPGYDSQAAFAELEDFTSDGFLNGAALTSGAVSGALPGVVSIDNTTGYNDYYQPFNYGQTFSFVLDVGGPAITAPDGTSASGSTFGLGLYDVNQYPILTTDPLGFVATATLNLDGTVTPQVFPVDDTGTPPVTSIEVETPEPGGLASIGIGLLLLWAGKMRTIPLGARR